MTTNPVPSDTDRLADIRARLDAATPAPWKASVVDSPRSNCSTAIYSHAYPAGDERSEVLPSYPIKPGYARMRRADAVLMANAPEDIAHLLSLVDSLQGRLDTAEGRLAKAADPVSGPVQLAIHRATCDESLTHCSEYRGQCVRSAEAAAWALGLGEGDGQ
jgi:hypothetical protein